MEIKKEHQFAKHPVHVYTEINYEGRIESCRDFMYSMLRRIFHRIGRKRGEGETYVANEEQNWKINFTNFNIERKMNFCISGSCALIRNFKDNFLKDNRNEEAQNGEWKVWDRITIAMALTHTQHDIVRPAFLIFLIPGRTPRLKHQNIIYTKIFVKTRTITYKAHH